MPSLLVSFFAGVLTVAAPCVLPVLPIILGGSAASAQGEKRSPLAPFVLIAGLVTSVILFSLILKASTSLIGVPQEVWQGISGGILLLFGLQFVFPGIWSSVSTSLSLQGKSDKVLERASHQNGLSGSFLMGAALGPVFNSCSPTYALIFAIILPASFAQGLAHLVSYSLGLGTVLLAIAFLGRSVVRRLRPLANPDGWLKKAVGVLFILVALLIITGYDKRFQAYALERGWYDRVSSFDQGLGN
jgi:cytochrome c biogenesis protein CcdA